MRLAYVRRGVEAKGQVVVLQGWWRAKIKAALAYRLNGDQAIDNAMSTV